MAATASEVDTGAFDADVIVVGSGFGGSVAALRLAEKGYRVIVLEAGRRFSDDELPKTSWRLRDFLWAPRLGLTGIQRIHLLRHVVVLAGAGVGGGSLVYANTLYVPPKRFFEDLSWCDITDWATELAPYYDQATRMLGVASNPRVTPADEVMRAIADEMGVGHTFGLAPVGVFFGEGPGVRTPDPFFGGAGPVRSGCTHCGECMTGCRWNAKNTLPKNYLALAESVGVEIRPLTTVTGIDPLAGSGYRVSIERTGVIRRRPRALTAEHVVIAAGAYNTQRLLHRMKDEGRLPNLSTRLGAMARTNSESILGAVARSRTTDFTEGVAITSSFFPDADTHVEPVRYGRGSNSMALLMAVITRPRPGQPRWRTFLGAVLQRPGTSLRLLGSTRRWSERTLISLVMQTIDNSVTTIGARSRLGRWHMTTRVDGNAAPTYIPVAHEVATRIGERIEGTPAASVFENFDKALTAHFVGGCTIGADHRSGVVDPYHRVFGHPGLHVVDGSTITANLGVNPSLTITAQAERAFALWPNRGDVDARPPVGATYQPVPAVPPLSPVVPEAAPGALRLPVIG